MAKFIELEAQAELQSGALLGKDKDQKEKGDDTEWQSQQPMQTQS